MDFKRIYLFKLNFYNLIVFNRSKNRFQDLLNECEISSAYKMSKQTGMFQNRIQPQDLKITFTF